MAQKIVFDTLQTNKEDIEITFDGTTYNHYNVETLKKYGYSINIPDESVCDDFDKIKIKGMDTEVSELCYLLTDLSKESYKHSRIKRIKIDPSITVIPENAFKDLTNLVEVSIPDSVTSIGVAAFSGCSSLTSISLPNSISSIIQNTFAQCTGLSLIVIPVSITSIGTRALNKCSTLKKINYKGTEEQWNAITKGSNWNSECSQHLKIKYNYIEN